MRVSVWKDEKGALSLLLEPSRGKRLSPVLVKDVPIQEMRGRAEQEITRMRGAPLAK